MKNIFDLLRCPADQALLEVHNESFHCNLCGTLYPRVGEKGILIDENRSIFKNEDIFNLKDKRQFQEKKGFKYQLRKLFPANPQSRDRTAEMNKLKDLLPDINKVLIIGCGFTGDFYKVFFGEDKVVLTDVTLQGDADIACDGHCLPFKDSSFDIIIADQVLEHVTQPWQVASEITRCIKEGGIVYSGIPFYFHMHGLPYDFQRFTPMGHRQLFPYFETIELKTSGGLIGVFSISMTGIFAAMSKNIWWRRFTSLAMRLIIVPFKWMDKFYNNKNKASTIPLATIFVGRRDGRKRNPAELLSEFL